MPTKGLTHISADQGEGKSAEGRGWKNLRKNNRWVLYVQLEGWGGEAQ